MIRLLASSLAIVASVCASLPAHAQSAADLSPHTLREWVGDQNRMALRPVRRGEHVRGLPVAEHTLSDVVFTWAGKSWTLTAFMEAHRISGVIALRDGQVVLERYGMGRAPTDRWGP